MSTDRWTRLSDWHNAWQKGDSAERRRLRDELTSKSPDLVAEADALVAASLSMTGFLETPAFVLTAAQLASDEAAMSPGTLVGPYQITTVIGRGGVGIVYRATDTRLDRQVALKTLASLGVPDELRVERFLREARMTASLDHPNIVKVFDVGTHDGQPFMVVELLEGETLRQRLDRGPVAEPDVLRIGIEIARGLVAAHAAGLVHRDLKPENVFLTRGGVTRILDFGIAKLAPETVRRTSSASTLTGILLGTAGYLAPEQIQGREADGRADLFALGSILFEMLTGQRAFACENTVDTLHAIVHESPPDLIRERTDISASTESIVWRLLRKAPEDRFQTAADLVWALEQPSTHVERVRARIEPAATGSTRRVRALPWIVALAAPVLIALTWSAWSMGRRSAMTTSTEVARFNWTLPPDTGLWSAPVVSPDGRRIVWAGGSTASSAQLYVRDLSSVESHALSGTTSARQPFWSPDGRWIGFFARGKLRKIAATGGPVTDIADAPDPRGGTWSPAGVIVYQPIHRDVSLYRVSDQGGPPQPVTTVDLELGDVSHRWPLFMPDGRHFLYFGLSVNDGRRGVYVGSLDGPTAQPAKPIFLSDSGAIYAPGASPSEGFLLSASDGRIEVRPFDVVRLIVTGDVHALEMNANPATPHHPALMSASAAVLAYASNVIPWGSQSARIDRDGSNLRVEPNHQLSGFPRISPDGRFLARHRVDSVRSNPDIWVEDLERGSTLRLTTSAELDVVPVWSPDGTQVAYRSGTLIKPTIGFAASDGSGVKRTMACPKSPCEPSDWSRDGRLVLTVGGTDIWTIPVGPEGQAQPLLTEPFTERDARLSPDGRWIAYVSDETGRPEVSVRSSTGTAPRYVVSSGGGDQPVWRRDGAELFFAGPEGHLFAVTVSPGRNGGLSFGIATKLNVPTYGERHRGTTYDVSLDGRSIYFEHQTDQNAPREFGVVLGWRALIK
jgi:eukaryotic-like serine/threonine-protein kinase